MGERWAAAEAMHQSAVAVVDWYGRGALHHMASGDGARVVVGAGGDVAAVDRFGWTPLHRAVIEDRGGVVSALVAAGADVDAVDKDGKTPLRWVALLV